MGSLSAGPLNRAVVRKYRNFRPITCYISETVEDRWVYTARRFTSIKSSFQPCEIYRDCPRSVHRGGKNVLKWRTFKLTAWITGKRLKIDGYMLRDVWQALNCLSIHVTFTAIVPWAYPGESKMWLKTLIRAHEYCWKPVTRHRYTAISQKWLKIDGYMLHARRLTSIEFSFDPCNIYRDSSRGVGYSADARSVGDSHPSCFNFVLH